MTPDRGGHCSFPFVVATPSSLSRTLEGLFELTLLLQGPSNSSRALLPKKEKQGHSQVCRTTQNSSRTPSIISDAHLDCVFVIKTLFYADP